MIGWPSYRPAAGTTLAVTILLVAAKSSLGAAAVPIADYMGKRVVSVELLQEGKPVQDQGLLDFVETSVGEPLLLEHVRESIVHLFSLGRFQDIRVDALAAQNGVALRYELVPLHAVDRMVFRGDPVFDENRLRQTIIERYGPAPAVALADSVRLTLEELYRENGFMHASVRITPDVEHERERTTLVFELDAGPRAVIGLVDVEAAPLVWRRELLDRADLERGGAYEKASIDQALARYARELRGRGYYEAVVSHTFRLREDGNTVDLALIVQPGPHVTVRFEGDPLPSARLEELVPIEREGSVDEDLLEDSTRRIADFLHGQGYWKAEVGYTPTQTGDELTLVFNVKKGRQYSVQQVAISGNTGVTLAELQPLVSMKPGEPFVQSRLERDRSAVAEQYRHLGFVDVSVETDVVESPTSGGDTAHALVTPRLLVKEGPRTLVGSVAFDGNAAITANELRAAVGLSPGRAFYRPQVALDRESVLLHYLNRGYQTATVVSDTQFDAGGTTADVVFHVVEGPQVLVDHVLILGNRRTSADTIRRELLLRPGQPLGVNDLAESQRRLAALGLFSRVRITELAHTDRITRDVLVAVEEAAATTIGYGGGLEAGKQLRRSAETGTQAVEQFEVVPRGFFEIGRRNLWGKNRSVNLFTRMGLRRKDVPANPAQDGRDLRFWEYRVIGTYREPKAFGTNADAVITGFVEQMRYSSFNLNRRGVHAEIGRQFGPPLRLSGRYSYGRNRLFDERFNQAEKPLIDRLFPQVSLSALSSTVVRDTRDDPVDPMRGGLVSFDGELAARRIGSEVGLAKTFVQSFVYRRVPGSRNVVVAAGARLGLATGFQREVARTDQNGAPVLGPDGRPLVDVVEDIPASERFFAGGDSTVRGFALDRLGDASTIDQDGFPKGGHALVVFNGEVRVPVWRYVGAVAFVDAGNVFARVNDLSLGNIRVGTGFGIRYKSPIGPIRVDLGFKLDRQRFANGVRESRTALHISIGQAF